MYSTPYRNIINLYSCMKPLMFKKMIRGHQSCEKLLFLGVSPKKGASETFGTDVIFCTARCSVLPPRIVLKVSSYSQQNSLPQHV